MAPARAIAVEEAPRLVVIRETPSLASALIDLLRAEGFGVAEVGDASEASRFAWPPGNAPRLLVAASNTRSSDAVARWFDGTLGGSELVVVGSRNPQLRSGGHLHVISLPLIPDDFLGLLRRLLAVRRETGPARHRPRVGLAKPPTRSIPSDRAHEVRIEPMIEAHAVPSSPIPSRE